MKVVRSHHPSRLYPASIRGSLSWFVSKFVLFEKLIFSFFTAPPPPLASRSSTSQFALVGDHSLETGTFGTIFICTLCPLLFSPTSGLYCSLHCISVTLDRWTVTVHLNIIIYYFLHKSFYLTSIHPSIIWHIILSPILKHMDNNYYLSCKSIGRILIGYFDHFLQLFFVIHYSELYIFGHLVGQNNISDDVTLASRNFQLTFFTFWCFFGLNN